jgi:hypothetical protein
MQAPHAGKFNKTQVPRSTAEASASETTRPQRVPLPPPSPAVRPVHPCPCPGADG